MYTAGGTAPPTAPTNPKVTGSVVTKPPMTKPPITKPPMTKPPITKPPVTKPPVTVWITNPPMNRSTTTYSYWEYYDNTTKSTDDGKNHTWEYYDNTTKSTDHDQNHNTDAPTTSIITAPTNPATTPTTNKSGGTGGTVPVASSGLIIRSPNAAIELGPHGDVVLMRSKPGVLNISAEQVVINGAVDAKEVLVNVGQGGDLTIKQYIQKMVLQLLKDKQDKQHG